MKRNILQSVVLTFIGLSVLVLPGGNWKVKSDEAVVEFTGGKISGSFKGLKADITFDKEHPEMAKISASIAVPTISTGFFLKNSHAKDALGADDHPEIKFSSTSVSKAGDAYLAKGNLTMKGVIKPMTIRFTFDDKGNQGLFKGTFKVIPKDFGVDRMGTPDEVIVNLTVPVSK